MKKLFGKFLTFVLALVLGLTTICVVGCGEGGNQFKALIVGGVTTTYRVGDDVNFDNIVVKVEYSDAKEDKTLTKNEYTVVLPGAMQNPSDLTAQEGTYTITIVYLDPLFSNAKREKAIVINVVPEDVEYIEGETLTPTSFTLPDTYGVYKNNVTNATNVRADGETDSAFEGKFMDVEDKNYYVGTDNGFTFLPKLRVNDAFRKFTANVAISVIVDDQPVALVASEVDDNKTVTYTLEDAVVATVDIYNHVYKFEDALDGKTVKVEVEPSATIYDWDEGSLSANFVIVKDAYNVQNANDLAVIDNVESDHNWAGGNITDVDWANWKTEKGITAECKFTSAPSRYTDASLIKKLEELEIGRPSTYAPTITTLTKSRGYVTKGDKTGEKHTVTNLTLRNGKIKSASKVETTGAERGRLLPQDIGMIVTDYLVKNFPNILDYRFTANVEEDFDKIAEGCAVWNGVIEDFYGEFHGKIENALSNREYSNVSRELGADPADGQILIAKFGQYGPYVQKGDGESKQFASLAPGQIIESITLEEALKLFELPRTVGQYNGIDIICTKGRFGPYIKYGDKNVSLPRGTDPLKVELEACIKLIEESASKKTGSIIHEFKESDIQVIDGAYGPYIKCGKSNYRIPKGTDATTLTEEKCKEIINSSEPTGRKKKR